MASKQIQNIVFEPRERKLDATRLQLLGEINQDFDAAPVKIRRFFQTQHNGPKRIPGGVFALSHQR